MASVDPIDKHANSRGSPSRSRRGASGKSVAGARAYAGEGRRSDARAGFADIVNDTAAISRRDGRQAPDLERLLDELHDAGDQLKRGGGADRVSRYKQAVREFVGHVVERAIGVERTSSAIGVQHRKRYLLVSVIDAKLERLASAVLQRQTQQMLIVERIDEINGLLVDLIA